MDTLNAFETLAQKVETVLEKYEAALKEKEQIQQQLDSQQKEHDELAGKVQTYADERAAVRQKIDSILLKIEQLGL